MSDMPDYARVTDEQLERLRSNYDLPEPAAEPVPVEVPAEPPAVPTSEPTGMMVALFVPADVADELAVGGGELAQDLHVTLAYLPSIPEDFQIEQLRVLVGELANTSMPLTGEISGVGLFTAGAAPVTYASVDIPALPEFRQRVVQALTSARESIGVDVAQTHGYTPHITLAFDDRVGDITVANTPLTFPQLSLAAGENRWHFNFAAEPEAAKVGDAQPPAAKGAEDELIKRNRMTPQAQVSHRFMQANWPGADGAPRCVLCGGPEPDGGICPGVTTQQATAVSTFGQHLSYNINLPAMPTPPTVTYSSTGINVPTVGEAISGRAWTAAAPDLPVTELTLPASTSKAFVTEVDGRTILTAQADASQLSDKALNKYFMRMTGRFVGAEKPNRNNALWASADLELGQHTVANGPLNWLHEARHIIGTIDSARFVTPDKVQAAAAVSDQPFIEASSVLWRWIYPDEAWVVQHASDAARLFYSMECISESVQCTGDGGCGAEASYADYTRGINGACEHMLQRSAVRHFKNPTFLGGAVIVPPVRPGWAEADLSVIGEAAALAEKAFDDAGRPDIPAAEWEQLMAQVVRFAKR